MVVMRTSLALTLGPEGAAPTGRQMPGILTG